MNLDPALLNPMLTMTDGADYKAEEFPSGIRVAIRLKGENYTLEHLELIVGEMKRVREFLTSLATVTKEAEAAATDNGFSRDEDGDWRASPGRFEGEPWYLPYFYQSTLDGMGEAFGTEDFTECEVIDVEPAERAAFGLAPDTTRVAVTFSEQGFLGLRELNEQDYKTLADSYASTDDDEQEG